jgi:hypothetical protein
MKATVYDRDARYWERVRHYIIQIASAWTKGSEGQALLSAVMAEDWRQTLQDNAPAGTHVSARDCAGVIIRNLLVQ